MPGNEGPSDRHVAYAQRVAERQARVGIIANTVDVVMPSAPPREVWTRWPKLRSARRREKARSTVRHDPLTDDPVLNGAALAAFAVEVRQDFRARLQDGTQPTPRLSAQSGRRWQIWALLALVMAIASGLIAVYTIDLLRF